MKKFLIGLSIALVWILIPIIFYLFGFKMTFLSPDFYKEELVENNFYNKSTDLIIETIIPTTGGVEIDEVEIKEVMTGAITPFWLQIQMEGIIDLIFLLLETDTKISEIDHVIDFTEPHNAVGELINTNMEYQLEAIPIMPEMIPDSTYEDAVEMINPVPEKIHLLALINELASTDSKSENTRVVDYEALSTKPDFIDNERLEAWQTTLETIQTVYLWVSIILIGSVILAAILILVSILLVRKSLVSIFKLLGNTFLIPGIIGVVSLIAQKVIFGFYKENLFTGTIAGTGSDLLSNLVNSMVQSFINFMLWPFGICLAIGLILLVIAFIIKKYNKSSK